MDSQQQLIYRKLKEAVALANAQDPMGVHQVVEPVCRYMITLLATLKGYEKLDKQALKELELDYHKSPQYDTAVLLQMINILDMTESIATRETHERTVSDL